MKINLLLFLCFGLTSCSFQYKDVRTLWKSDLPVESKVKLCLPLLLDIPVKHDTLTYEPLLPAT